MTDVKDENVEAVDSIDIEEIFQPLNDNVLILKDKAEKERVTAGGIIVKNDNRPQPNTAKVLAVGPDVKIVKKGDTIILGTWSGTNIDILDEKYIVVEENLILGILKG